MKEIYADLPKRGTIFYTSRRKTEGE